jgi:hypothetical protein
MMFQDRPFFQIQSSAGNDPTLNIIFIVVVAVIVLVVVIVGVMNRGATGKSSSYTGPKKISKQAIIDRAANSGLSRIQIKTLLNLIHTYGCPNPLALFSNPAILDSLLKRSVQAINGQASSIGTREAQKSTIYAIKHVIERSMETKKTGSSTKSIKEGQKITMVTPQGGRFPTRVTANLDKGLAVLTPMDMNNRMMKMPKNIPIRVYFMAGKEDGYTFRTKVTGVIKFEGITNTLLAHSPTVFHAQQRRFRRREIDSPCYFFLVDVISTPGKGKTAVISNKDGTLGMIQEISAGGCSMRTNYPLPPNSLVKIDFETSGKHKVIAYGKVKKIGASGRGGSIMHIQFTRMSAENLNKINAYVYSI